MLKLVSLKVRDDMRYAKKQRKCKCIRKLLGTDFTVPEKFIISYKNKYKVKWDVFVLLLSI